MKGSRVFLLCALVFTAITPLLPGQTEAVRPKIVVAGLSPEEVSALQEEFPQAEFASAGREELQTIAVDADALVGTCNRDAIRAAKKLRWVQIFSAGAEYCVFPEMVNSDIALTNAKIVQGPEIADHAMALLLALTRNLNVALSEKASRSWDREKYNPIELRGKTALIIGLGGIGTQVAERAHGFGMRVLAVDPKDIPLRNSVERVEKPDRLLQLLPQADVLFMCAPHTARTERMMSTREFGAMKTGSFFINVSRGKTVDTEALVEALKEGRLAGAGLDVTDPEPLPAQHPLWAMPNVVITPHIAGQSDQIEGRIKELMRENVERFLKGLPLRNLVDKSAGY